MSRQEIVKLVTETVMEIQEKSGRPVPTMTGETRPLLDLAGFDSLNGLELTHMLAAALGFEPPMTLCKSDDGRRALSITGIADKVHTLTSDKETARD